MKMTDEVEGTTTHGDESLDAERQYMVFNATDGIPASPEPMTWREAHEFIAAFPERFATRGYCRTSRGNRIPPEEVVLLILDSTTLTLDLAIDRLADRCGRGA